MRRNGAALMWATSEHPDVVLRSSAERTSRGRTRDAVAPRRIRTPRAHRKCAREATRRCTFRAAGDLNRSKALLAAGAKVNKPAADGMTPFLLACANSYESVALFLLEKGADPHTADGNGVAPLHYAIGRGLSLTSAGGRGGGAEPPNMRKLVEGLLAKRANPNVRLGKPPVRMRLVGAPQIDPEGATPFLLAAASRDLPLLKLLLVAGADPEATTTDNTTALMMAAGVVVRGGRPNKQQEKEVPRSCAARRARERRHAVNTNIERTINGKTAVHAATYQGMDSVIQFLAEGRHVATADRWRNTDEHRTGRSAQLRYQMRIRGGQRAPRSCFGSWAAMCWRAKCVRGSGGIEPIYQPEEADYL